MRLALAEDSGESSAGAGAQPIEREIMVKDDFRYALGQTVQVRAGAQGLLSKADWMRVKGLGNEPRAVVGRRFRSTCQYMLRGAELWVSERFLDLPLERGSWDELTRAIGKDIRK